MERFFLGGVEPSHPQPLSEARGGLPGLGYNNCSASLLLKVVVPKFGWQLKVLGAVKNRRNSRAQICSIVTIH